jgi:hypothetical protein
MAMKTLLANLILKSSAYVYCSISLYPFKCQNDYKNCLPPFVADEFSSSFLIKHDCNVNAATNLDKETASHLVASFNPDITDGETLEGMSMIAQQLLDAKADANVQDSEGK